MSLDLLKKEKSYYRDLLASNMGTRQMRILIVVESNCWWNTVEVCLNRRTHIHMNYRAIHLRINNINLINLYAKICLCTAQTVAYIKQVL
jgi:hypothetical protein